jgi:gamma-glutamyltranspeptidase/glutathione hydrolase
VVVAVEPLAAGVGVRILERGGNAADAAIATTLALSVTHSSAASLGGGGFALVRRDGSATEAFDFREVAPRALTRPDFDRMIADGARGPLAIGVPGTVAGLVLIHQRFGSRPLAELVEPAIALARDGHALREWQARVLGWSYPALARDPAARVIFGRAGRARRAGTRLVQTDLAATLERLATSGADDFYRGETARRLALALGPSGPTLADLAAYRAIQREPLRFRYRGFTVETMPPPSAGGVTLAGILLTTQALAPAPAARDSVESIHTFLEASRRAQAERRLGVVDPETLSREELAARTARWLDAAFWQKVPIDAARATPSEHVHSLYALESRESEHTTHLSVADGRGMVVSLTTTLSASFGAKLVAHATGIVMNNAVASFSFAGDNQPGPAKRTTSSMAPTLLLQSERVAAVLGTPGGDSIPSTLAQVVANLIDHHLPLDRAITAPRWHHGFVPDVARYEEPASSAALLELARRGHQLRPFRRPIGDANCIVFDGERAHGFADPREQGAALAPADAPPSPDASATLR